MKKIQILEKNRKMYGEPNSGEHEFCQGFLRKIKHFNLYSVIDTRVGCIAGFNQKSNFFMYGSMHGPFDVLVQVVRLLKRRPTLIIYL